MVFMPRSYSKELREGALQLVREGERLIAEIAQSLGIAESCLRRWIKQAELDSGKRDDGLTTKEREERRRLRWENARLKQRNRGKSFAVDRSDALMVACCFRSQRKYS
jgi:transposase